MQNYQKYRPFPPLNMPNRKWPSRQITKAPIWCSVDLRDGNQALEVPMTFQQKLDFFEYLVKIGFKEIEIGFPAASDTEYNFCRALIERDMIPDDVTIQVLTQSREHIIRKTFEAVKGARHAIVHLYNSTSTLQRDVVFNMNKEQVKQLAVDGAVLFNQLAKDYHMEHFQFEYSPESFSGTEMDYAVEVCDAVLDVWKPTPDKKVIINLPNTVEVATPNVHADQIEYVCDHIKYRDSVIISLHAHNDRGCAVAATELGLMAGADRVEGTLFGNGERTGNADIMNIAMNLYSQGIDPGLDFSHMSELVEIYERSTGLWVHPRHPYAGKLVYTAFSGSHQDAIKKGMARCKEHPDYWEVPYLPIDPADVGRSYDPIIRINSQSGKGGVSYVLQEHYGMLLPRDLQKEFGPIVTQISDERNEELSPKQIYDLFMNMYIVESPILLQHYTEEMLGKDRSAVRARILFEGDSFDVEGDGIGIISAFCKAMEVLVHGHIEVINYAEHSLSQGSASKAITYIHLKGTGEKTYFGAGISSNVSKSSLRGIVSAVNRMLNDTVK